MNEEGTQGDREALVSLRVGVARVAQAFGMEGGIPGQTTGEVNYQTIYRSACDHERGWHTLCSQMVDRIRELRQLSGCNG